MIDVKLNVGLNGNMYPGGAEDLLAQLKKGADLKYVAIERAGLREVNNPPAELVALGFREAPKRG